jgi:hypothetical protein
LHRATQKNLPITVAAAGLPQIPRLTGEARSYAERLFSFPVMAKLSDDDATAALVEPVRQQDVEYEPEAVARALEWTGGYPFYIQQFSKHAWNLADRSPITAANVEAAVPAAQAGQGGTLPISATHVLTSPRVQADSARNMSSVSRSSGPRSACCIARTVVASAR